MEDRVRVLVEIAQTLDSATDEAARLSRSMALTRTLLRAARCSLLFETETGERVLVSAPPTPTGEVEAAKAKLAALLELRTSSEVSPELQGARLGLPLVGLDEVAGFLLVERPLPPFDYGEIRVFSLVAAQLGGYLTMLRLQRKAIELDRFKQEMFALVVHDLKNPLAAVISNLDLVAMDAGVLGKEAMESLTDAQRSSQRIVRLVENLLDLARLEARRLSLATRSVDLSALLLRVMKERGAQAQARQITILAVDVPAGVMVELDEHLFTRVVENILDNALRYTPPSGRIEVRVTRSQGRVEIRMGNTGPAIALEDHGKIFEKFGQASVSGRMNLGLGLYFGRLAMEAHGGKIWVESAPALPTVFVLSLPA